MLSFRVHIHDATPKKNAYEFAKCHHLFFKDPKPKKLVVFWGTT